MPVLIAESNDIFRNQNEQCPTVVSSPGHDNSFMTTLSKIN